MTESTERIFLQEGTIKITNRRAIIGSKTYTLADTTSVSLTVRHDKGLVPLVLILMGAVVGIIFVISSINAEGTINWTSLLIGGIIALVFLGLGLFVHIRSKPLYIIKLESSSGGVDLLQSYDQGQIRRIIEAVNKGIGSKV